MGVYTESAKQIYNSSVDALSAPMFMINCAETERKLFEAVIELDFAEVYNESGVIYLSEADQQAADEKTKTSFGEKIKSVWRKFIETITNAFNTVISKIDEFIKGTAGLIKVSKKLDSPEIKKCQVEQLWFADLKKGFDDEWNRLQKAQVSIEQEGLGSGAAASNDTFLFGVNAENLEKFKMELKVAVTKVEQNLLHHESPLGNHNMSELKAVISMKNVVSDIKGTFEAFKKNDKINALISKADNSEKASKGFKYLTTITGIRLKMFSYKCTTSMKVASLARKNYVTLINYVSKPGKYYDESATEAETLSDLFCESVFGLY